VGVEDAERRRLLAQVGHHARERRVFDDLGEVSGVVSVAIVHRSRQKISGTMGGAGRGTLF
jgi:hypothetical protein